MAVKVPKTMSTQHPDNVTMPFFVNREYFDGEDEIREAYYVFSHLGCDEQMWDCEGKEVDEFVVKKLLTYYPDFFSTYRLGRELRITLRVPNPSVEATEAKLLPETLEIIPRSYDAAEVFYGQGQVCPIFEVIVPMVTSARELNRIFYYYKDFVAGKGDLYLRDGTRIRDWLGEFRPEEIGIIPLFEDIPIMLNCHKILEEYMKDKKFEEVRVFLARSDPALNYGFIPATLAAKMALLGLDEVDNFTIHPIIGVGTTPFRGFLSPENLRVLDEYPSIRTFTVQSAFKYDYPPDTVRRAIDKIKRRKPKRAQYIDDTVNGIIERMSKSYRDRIPTVANFVNSFSRYIPRKRMRKLHIGLFGYARGDGVKLPRAITFCATLYSIGFPPELIGFAGFQEKDLEVAMEYFPSLEDVMEKALSCYNPESLKIIPLEEDVKKAMEFFEYNPDEEHLKATSEVIEVLSMGRDPREPVIRAGKIRGFLG
jgi:phosphoenolpyruvate carboxylase